MQLKHIFKTASRAIIANRMRSSLTILGIVIGITSIMMVLSLGAGAQKIILGQIQGLGSRTIAVIPGRHPEGLTDVASIFLDSLKPADLDSLENKTNVPEAEIVMPVVFGPVRLSYLNETHQATMLGGGSRRFDNALGQVFDLSISEGALFNSTDVKSKASVAVIGDKVRRELFGESEALDKKIKINSRNFRVVGVLPSKGQVSFFNFDDMVLVPYTTAADYILGRKHFDRLIVVARAEAAIAATVADIERTLRANHKITDPEKDDFFVETQADIAARLLTVTSVMTLFLVSIAAISLLVGGIGIMNIMLVSVTERTSEIGLRKALGATSGDILRQFLTEAVILTAAGGTLGIILGSLFSFLSSAVLSHYLNVDWDFSFPIVGTIVGLAVSAGVGLVFGLYPARRAALKDPIEALRYE